MLIYKEFCEILQQDDLELLKKYVKENYISIIGSNYFEEMSTLFRNKYRYEYNITFNEFLDRYID